MIIAHIQEIEQPGKLFFVNGKWQMKELTQEEIQTIQGLKAQLADLYTLLKEPKMDHKIPEQLMDIGDKQLLKEVIGQRRKGDIGGRGGNNQRNHREIGYFVRKTS